MSPRNEVNSDVKQEKERVHQYLHDEKIGDTSVLVKVQAVFVFFTYSRNEALSNFIETTKNCSKHFLKLCFCYSFCKIFLGKSRNHLFLKFDWFSLVGSQSNFGSSNLDGNK